MSDYQPPQINYTEEELKCFAQRAAAKMSRNHLSGKDSSEGPDGMHNGITSSHGSKRILLVLSGKRGH